MCINLSWLLKKNREGCVSMELLDNAISTNQYQGKIEFQCSEYARGLIWNKSEEAIFSEVVLVEVYENGKCTDEINVFLTENNLWRFEYFFPKRLAHCFYRFKIKGSQVYLNNPVIVFGENSDETVAYFEQHETFGRRIAGYAIDFNQLGKIIEISVYDEKKKLIGETRTYYKEEVWIDSHLQQIPCIFYTEVPVEYLTGQEHAMQVEFSHCIYSLLFKASLDYDGFVEYIDAKRVEGWVISRSVPEERVEVEIRSGETLLGFATANRYRKDLVEAGLGDGCYAFKFIMETELDLKELSKVAVYVRNDEYKLSYYGECLEENERIEVEPSKPMVLREKYEGFLDEVTEYFVRGWGVDLEELERPVSLDVFMGGLLVGRCYANRYRIDLHEKFNAGGCHAFYFDFPLNIKPDKEVEVSVRFSANGHSLKKSPKSLIIGQKGILHNSKDSAWEEKTQELLYKKVQVDEQKRIGMNGFPQIAIIIVNLNGAQLLEEMFASFTTYNTYPHVEFIIVDHGSEDDSRKVCEQWKGRYQIVFLARGDNYSFSNSNNYAIDHTDAELLLFLNNDIVFCQDILSEMVDILRDEEVGLVGVKLLDETACKSSRVGANHPVQHMGIHFDFFHPDKLLRAYDVRYAPQLASVVNSAWEVPGVTGAVMFCRKKEFIQAGLFSEEYFYGFEDVDFCLAFGLKIRKKIICANHLNVIHHRGFTRFKSDSKFHDFALHNRDTLEKKFGYMLRKNHLKSFFEGNPFYWTSFPLRIGFLVTEASEKTSAGDFFTAWELGEYLSRNFGYQVCYVEARKEGNSVESLDVIINMLHDYDIRKLQNQKPTLIKIGWARNWFEAWVGSGWASEYNFFFASSQSAAAFIQAEVGTSAYVLPIASNPERFEKGRELAQYKSDYCFTGSFWGYARDISAMLDPSALPFDFAVYGQGWEKEPKFNEYFKGYVPYEELPAVYASTKIVIDDANHVTKQWGSVNSRVFDALAAGALVITNGKKGSEEVFDGLLPVYDSPCSLEQLLYKYLTDDFARQELVNKLQNIVFQKHTYSHRAVQMHNYLKEKMCRAFRISIKIGAPRKKDMKEWGDYHFAIAMKKKFEEKGHIVRIDPLKDWYHSPSMGDDVVIVLRGLSEYKPKPYHINIMWNISHPDKISISEYNAYDYVFVASVKYAEELRGKLQVPVETLLQCTDPEVFYPAETDTPADLSEGILFVGNSRKIYRDIVKKAVADKIAVDVYGTNWGLFIPPALWKGEHIENKDLRNYYSSCKVLLNDHWESMRECGFISNRIFDALACGAMVVSDSVDGIEELFGDCVFFCSKQVPLQETIDEAVAYKKANAGKIEEISRIVRTEHTFENRITRMLSAIQEVHSKKMQGVYK